MSQFAMKVTVNTTEIRKTKKEKIKTDNKNASRIGYFKEVFQKYEEGADNNYYAMEPNSFPNKNHSLLEQMKQYRKCSQRMKMLSHQRELTYFKTPYPPPTSDCNKIRSIEAVRNENTIISNEVSASEDEFTDRVDKHAGIKEVFIKNLKDEQKINYFDNKTKPTVQNPENLTNKGFSYLTQIKVGKINKEDQHDQTYYDEIEVKLRLSQEPEIIFTEDEKHQLDNLVSEHEKVYHSVNIGEVLIKEMIMCSMFTVPVSTSAAIRGYRIQVERITRIANSLKCFTDLHKVDQVALLKENADLLVSLHGAIFFDRKKKGMDQLLSSMGTDDMEIINQMFKPLIQTHSMNHIDYKVFNSIQDPANKVTEERNIFLQVKVADAIMDNITTILVTYIILFSSDFCSLEDRKSVERNQHHFLRMLERFIYSDSSHYRACSRMAQTLNAVTCVREMADIKKSRAINHNYKATATTTSTQCCSFFGTVYSVTV